jgi:hypothetical protein
MPARRRASESRREAIARAPAIVHVRIPAGSPARERISPRTRDRAAPAILAQPGSRNQASSRIRRMRHLPSTSLAISPLTRKAASARVTPSRLTGPPTLDMGSRADHRIGLQAKVHSPPGACCRSAARIGVAIFEPGPSRNPARPLPTHRARTPGAVRDHNRARPDRGGADGNPQRWPWHGAGRHFLVPSTIGGPNAWSTPGRRP